ncbi:MAG: hypothetical protein PVH41_01945 [Anaerolineae bacterium]
MTPLVGSREVQKRHVTRLDGDVTYFYCNKRGQGKDWSRRYRLTRGSRL